MTIPDGEAVRTVNISFGLTSSGAPILVQSAFAAPHWNRVLNAEVAFVICVDYAPYGPCWSALP